MNSASIDISADKLRQMRAACACLFSPRQANDDVFLRSLDMEQVRKAFREKARHCHPDLHRGESSLAAARWSEQFMRARQAYELIIDCIPKEETAVQRPLPRIIAVGGAKGGIGKSILAANLGVHLARMGRKTVVVDLDLGGANLHLYMGMTRMQRSINDFLDRTAPTLESIMAQTKHGPWLIGGDSSRLGAGNIPFAVKMRLIKAVKNLDADHVILDLGGDTSFNVMDFFLSADRGLVLTTCDPASYLEAYNFIKVGLFRKLNRIFGEENPVPAKRYKPLEELIRTATMPKGDQKACTVTDILSRVESQQPAYAQAVRKAVSGYSPFLAINRENRPAKTQNVVDRIREVSRKMLNIDVRYSGCLPNGEEVENSARCLVPVLSQCPHGEYSKGVQALADQLA
ncbi:flagellar biosynthesis protein FlhG [Desulfatibacillum alkenivorans DSM 16219]|jgi:flagellar biosynthesis protein FlhG|uniref:Flagellar biosynthesis protein FlhG n=1 Tax=Desulfatibacillum alkenivorans DSM 16219 TaxID=1121393 RepID=A0A1M6NZ20_9BACT|nr:P-loop NTPase [Desulfatibacillum alkenivorans]SHK00965.1 flagellar biosynthesis protein FlhG [Desulfatibacillum alkenivorans DSM 16219]